MIESNGGTRPIQVAGRDAKEVSVSRFNVLVVEGPDKGHRAQLSSTSLRIGTDPSNDLVLSDPTISKHHALMTLSPEGILVEDLGSLNGSVLDGTRIRSAFVGPSSVLKLGDSLLKVTPSEAKFVVVPDEDPSFQGMVARSQAMRDVFAFIRQLAKTDLPVAVTGETGTGKELVARALHNAGPRRDQRFVVLDCGSILPDLIRSELFGHEKGAFTGADRQTKGVLEEAAGGTVFLDEIGEIHLSVQPNLLRALETKEICRVGSRSTIPVDFRIVSATNRDLKKASVDGTFRQDLYYRLSCVTLKLPALRERVEDIPLLVQHFLQQCASRHHVPLQEVTPQALDALTRYSWPGNLRELKNTVEALWAKADGGKIQGDHVVMVLPRAEPDAAPPAAAAPKAEAGNLLQDAERSAIEQALRTTGWNRKAAARLLGISNTTIFEKIKRYGLKPPDAAED